MKFFTVLNFSVALSSCSYHVEKTPELPTALTANALGFAEASKILGGKCSHCHGWTGDFDRVHDMLDKISSHIQSNDPGFLMPPPGNAPLTTSEKAALLAWIANGGPMNAGETTAAPSPSAPPTVEVPELNFAFVNRRVFAVKCIRCHSADFDNYEHARPLLKEISFRIHAIGENEQMPPSRTIQLDPDEIRLLDDWIDAGAPDSSH